MTTNAGGRFGQSALMLAGVSRLRDFTVTELAQYAGVSVEAARSFLRRRKADVTCVGTQRSNGSGRPSDVYRLRPERRDEVAGRVARFSRRLSPGMPRANGDTRPTLADLADATLLSVAAGDFDDPLERTSELDAAEQLLSAARASVEARRGERKPVDDAEMHQIAKAELRLSVLRLPQVAVPDDATRTRLESRVSGWLPADGPPSGPGIELSFDGAGAWLDAIMAAVGALPPADQVHAAGVLVWRTLDRAGRNGKAVGVVVTQLLRAQGGYWGAAELSTLAIAAALSDATEAAVPLMTHLLMLEQREAALRESRLLCRSAIANLAGRAKVPDAAASCCLYLLAAATDDDERLLLIPPAFLARNGHPLSLFKQLAATAGRVPVPPSANVRGALRNLALALAKRSFAQLDETLESLLEDDGCMNLIVMLRQDALDLTDGRESPFRVRLGPWAGDGDYMKLSLPADGSAANRLTDIIQSDQPRKARFLDQGSRGWTAPAHGKIDVRV